MVFMSLCLCQLDVCSLEELYPKTLLLLGKLPFKKF